MKSLAFALWRRIAVSVVALGAAGAAAAQDAGVAFIFDGDGNRIGTATLCQTQDGVAIRIDVDALPPAEHVVHIHERGNCNPRDGFKAAGGFLAGKSDKPVHHAGDLHQQRVAANGGLRGEAINPHVAISRASLLDEDGSALVIHARRPSGVDVLPAA